jgi:hypothetical protein
MNRVQFHGRGCECRSRALDGVPVRGWDLAHNGEVASGGLHCVSA